MFAYKMKWYYISIIEATYILANLYIVVCNVFWLSPGEVNFIFIFFLTLLLSPMLIFLRIRDGGSGDI